MSGVYSVPGLLFALEAVGARVELNAAGDGVKIKADTRPPADLLEAAREMKPDILAFLAGRVGALPLSPDVVQILPAYSGEQVSPAPLEDLPDVSPTSGDNLPPLPDWAKIAAQPGHCGSCGRASDAPDWGALMVTCGCPANAFEAGLKPLALHVGHRCAAYRQEGEEMGGGWRRKGTGKTWGPVPDAVAWEDLPPLDGGHVQGGAA